MWFSLGINNYWIIGYDKEKKKQDSSVREHKIQEIKKCEKHISVFFRKFELRFENFV